MVVKSSGASSRSSRKKTNLIAVLLIAAIFLFACNIGSGTPISPQEAYQNYLNLELPDQVTDLQYEGADGAIVLTSQAFFTYKATPDYFALLEEHNKFIESSEFNQAVHQISCQAPNFPDDFSYWTEQAIDLNGPEKSCFTGTFFPYVHYIIYDAETEQVNHFVTGMAG